MNNTLNVNIQTDQSVILVCCISFWKYACIFCLP